jgi:hypothetical protein
LEYCNVGIVEKWVLASGSESPQGLPLGEDNGMMRLKKKESKNKSLQ